MKNGVVCGAFLHSGDQVGKCDHCGKGVSEERTNEGYVRTNQPEDSNFKYREEIIPLTYLTQGDMNVEGKRV